MHPQVPVFPERMVRGAEIACEDEKEGHARGLNIRKGIWEPKG